jgi:hypothetical protein
MAKRAGFGASLPASSSKALLLRMSEAFFIPLVPSSKHSELATQAPLPRGEAIKEKIEALHANAEDRAFQNLSTRAATAQLHNQKASFVAAGAKMADTIVFHERAINVAMDMAAHDERRANELQKKRAKATREINKVCDAVAALQDQEVIREKEHIMKIVHAEERRQQHLSTVSAKAAAETAKVVSAAAKKQAETMAKAMANDQRHFKADLYRCEVYYEGVTKEKAKHEAACARREAAETAHLAKAACQAEREMGAVRKAQEHLEAVAAKAHAEATKVEAASARLAEETASKAAKIEEKLAAAAVRKAAVTYPPCARTKKPTPTVAPTTKKMAIRVALALAGGAIARSLFVWGVKLGGLAKLSAAGLLQFGSRVAKAAAVAKLK